MEIDQPVKEVNMECVCGSLDLVSAEKKKDMSDVSICDSVKVVSRLRRFVILDS